MKNNSRSDIGARILFVDDEPDVLTTYKRFAKKRGLTFDLALSGEDALALIEHTQYAVVVTDFRMPGMDGLDVIDRIQLVQPNTVFIMVTASTDLYLPEERSATQVISAIVMKPWDYSDLGTALTRASKLHAHRQLAASSETCTCARETVLLVEDNPGDAELVAVKLAGLDGRNYDVIHVELLRDALLLLEDQTFSVVLVDLSLPDARGLDSVRRIRKKHKSMPIVVFTGNTDHELALEALQAGAQDYLVKNKADPSALDRAIRYSIERKDSSEEMLQLAHYDDLTGLANRKLFRERLSHYLLRLKLQKYETGAGPRFAVLFMDLDHFKAINDTLGHDAGDRVLVEASARLLSVVHERDTVARFGGDEFAIIVENVANDDDLRQLAERIAEAFASGVLVQDQQVALQSSIGIAVFPADGSTIESLLKAADLAMYEAKHAGRNGHCFYSNLAYPAMME